MSRKRIGVLIAQPDDIYQSRLMRVILDDAFSHDCDVLVFSTMIKQEGSDAFIAGEMNIFELINYDKLDAVIFVPDTIKVDGIASKLMAQLKERFHGPTVLVDYEGEGFHSVMTDDIEPLCELTAHLANCHGCRRIAMVSGMKGHLHAENRVMGYKKALEERSIPIDESLIFYGDFWYTTGELIINDLFEDGKLRPDGIVCASGHIAVGVCEALKAKGVRIPEELPVVAYDVTKDTLYDPLFTNITPPVENSAHKAMEYIFEQWGEGSSVHKLKNPIMMNVMESCGCSGDSKAVSYEVTYGDMNFQSQFFSTANFMMEELIATEALNDFLGSVSWYSYQIGSMQKFCFCMCDDWDYSEFGNHKYRKTGYSDDIRLCIEKTDGVIVSWDSVTFKKEEMLPALYEDHPTPRVFYFIPAHFNERCFGYFAISPGNSAETYDPCVKNWIRNVNNGLESLRLRNKLKWYSRLMAMNARTDALTGIENRFAFDELRGQIEEGTRVFLILGDLNRLKYINDNFGHGEGDFAIKAAASAFAAAAEVESNNGIVKSFRYGGDEFLTVAVGNFAEDEYKKIIGRIQDTIEYCNSHFDKPYIVSVSLGSACGVISGKDDFSKLLNLADKSMFDIKQEFHKKVDMTEWEDNRK